MTQTFETINEAKQALLQQTKRDYHKHGAITGTVYAIAQRADGKYVAGGLTVVTPQARRELAQTLTAEHGLTLIETLPEPKIVHGIRAKQTAEIDRWYAEEIKPLMQDEQPAAQETQGACCRHGVPYSDDCAECDADA